jgi:rhodanese-related sulfurtransferase
MKHLIRHKQCKENTMSKRTLITFVVLVVLTSAFYVFAQDNKSLISPVDVNKLIQNDSTVVVLDVRTPSEFSSVTGHLARAILIPVQELEQRVDELQKYKRQQIIVYCRTGHRSTRGTEILQQHGYTARNMEGGITRWRAEQLPTINEHP